MVGGYARGRRGGPCRSAPSPIRPAPPRSPGGASRASGGPVLGGGGGGGRRPGAEERPCERAMRAAGFPRRRRGQKRGTGSVPGACSWRPDPDVPRRRAAAPPSGPAASAPTRPLPPRGAVPGASNAEAAPILPARDGAQTRPAFANPWQQVRNRLERAVDTLTQCRRLAPRYEKRAAHFLAMIKSLTGRLWLRAYEGTRPSATAPRSVCHPILPQYDEVA